MKPAEITQAQIAADPYLIWNTFLDTIGVANIRDLDPIQRAAYLALRYNGEVHNGGHHQFFENGSTDFDDTIGALAQLGAQEHKQVLEDARRVYLSRLRQRSKTVEEFVAAALEGEFKSLDSRFYECSPSLDDLLMQYVERHQSSFVRLI